MTKNGLYFADHLTAKKAAAKLEVYDQTTWFKKSALKRSTYNNMNYQARVMFTTFVGGSYGVYQLGEGLVEVARALANAGYNVGSKLAWCLEPSALEVVKNVADLYETILGSTDAAGWNMYSGFFQLPMQGKWLVKEEYTKDALTSKQVLDVAATEANYKQVLADFTRALTDMSANVQYAVQFLDCLKALCDVKQAEKAGAFAANDIYGIVLAIVYTQFEQSRGNWVGHYYTCLNGGNLTETKCDAQRTATAVVNTQLMKPGSPDKLSKALEHSHILWVLHEAFTPEILGGELTGTEIVFKNKEDKAPALERIMAKMTLRQGLVQEDDMIEQDVSVAAEVIIAPATTDTFDYVALADIPVFEEPVGMDFDPCEVPDFNCGDPVGDFDFDAPVDYEPFDINPNEKPVVMTVAAPVAVAEPEVIQAPVEVTPQVIQAPVEPEVVVEAPKVKPVINTAMAPVCEADIEQATTSAELDAIEAAIKQLRERAEKALEVQRAVKARKDALLAELAEVKALYAQLQPEFLNMVMPVAEAKPESFGESKQDAEKVKGEKGEEEGNGGSKVPNKPNNPKPSQPTNSPVAKAENVQPVINTVAAVTEPTNSLPTGGNLAFAPVDTSVESAQPVDSTQPSGATPEHKLAVISGSRAIKELPEEAKAAIDDLIKAQYTFRVGDAAGIDSLVQGYLKSKNVENVTVWHAGNYCRNNVGFKTVSVNGNYVARDAAMHKGCVKSIVIWDGISNGSRNNIKRVADTLVVTPEATAKAPKAWDVSNKQVSSNRKQIADLLVKDVKASFQAILKEYGIQEDETFGSLFKRDKYAKEAFCMCVSESQIFEFRTSAEFKATLSEWFVYLWETGFIDNINGTYPDISEFDAVEEFNKLLKQVDTWMRDNDRFRSNSFWDYNKSVGLDLFPNATEFVIGYNGKGLFNQYPWIMEAPVHAFLDILRYAVYNADYHLPTYRANISANTLELMNLSWFELVYNNEIVTIQTEWNEQLGNWWFHSYLKMQQKPAVIAKKSQVANTPSVSNTVAAPVEPELTTLVNSNNALNVANSIYIGRNAKTYPNNYGNPYSCIPGKGILAPDNDTSFVYFEEWLYGTRDTHLNQTQRNWIINQLAAGKLTGKTIACYKHGGRCHGDVLRDISNGVKPLPKFQPNTVAIAPVEPEAKTYSLEVSNYRSYPPVPHQANHTPCQTKFFELAATGANIFLTGKAGTGKTYSVIQLINHWASLNYRVVVMGSTGISVMNMGGELEPETYQGLGTVNSCLALGIGFDETRPNNESDWQWANKLVARGEYNQYVKQLLTCKTGQKGLKVVIDEISMIDSRMLWVIHNIIRKHNPLAQILVVGDGGQLKAVGQKAIPFYQRPVIDGCGIELGNLLDTFKVVQLNTGVRQANDRAFEDALDHLWATNEMSGVILDRFIACLKGDKPADDANVTHIRFNNVSVENINYLKTKALTTEKRVYKGIVRNIGAQNTKWLKNFAPISVEMELAVGMPVKLRKNRKKKVNNQDVLEAANGSRGIITELGKDFVMVNFNGTVLKVEPVVFEGPTKSNGELTGKFTQLPLHPDFASTGHSCQGLTITNPVVIGIYEERAKRKAGHVTYNQDGTIATYKMALTDREWLYVACSRVTKAEDLYFDCSDANCVNLKNAAEGAKDTSYQEWLQSRLAQ